ncbi:protein-methionine-sulfoxide reductase heme-binding subunit MsrQ [Psychromonas sp. 14N.309.X.WAT.B.A12]|uniref:protein-methionine-sulfoxide reductase heme-binding subunit MsrQ n=1 Tax=unclassified Psychromonas TaxID=2614957 RepID=UPI0025B23BF8|nr:protein-methionine-sulfoxide reductase heme-binding subunit MsrQ [Psychromonas sp. 14N.309.X.WAT.B.A12]MDN2665027.1 sulfoxide reductase heme-binding subunit YedZ [Psychromonas sp. 14N.309.X.WAT.B.A12]
MSKIPPLAITLLKAIIHLASLSTLLYFYILIDSNRLGADPVKEMIHFLGKTGLNYLLITLAITPLAKRFKQPLLLRLKRVLGLYSFAWICLHFTAFLWLELNWKVGLLIEETIKRPYLTLGMAAGTILLLLSITSINAIRRSMKQAWFTLHRWVYVALILGTVHYYWSVKSGVIEPSIYFALCFILLSERRQYFKSIYSSVFNKAQK